MKMGSGYDIPGKAGRRARFETRSVVYEVGDDHLQDLWRESMGLSIHSGTCGVDNPKRERIVDCGFGPFPDDEIPYYDVLTTEYGDQVNWDEVALATWEWGCGGDHRWSSFDGRGLVLTRWRCDS